MKVSTFYISRWTWPNGEIRWNPLLLPQYLGISKEYLFNQVCHSTFYVRIVFYCALGDSLNQGDLVVEIVH